MLDAVKSLFVEAVRGGIILQVNQSAQQNGQLERGSVGESLPTGVASGFERELTLTAGDTITPTVVHTAQPEIVRA